MERRLMLKRLLAGGVYATLTIPAFAQTGRPQPESAKGQPPRVANANGGAPRPDSNILITTPAELESVLQEWEQKTARIKRLQGTHHRYEYDSVFAVEKRSIGEFWHEAPDKGRIDFKEAPTTDPKTGEPIVSKKRTPAGEVYTIQSEDPLTWVCDGKSVIQIEHRPKTYGLAEIPPQHQGENILDSPLPFLFGMKTDRIKRRFRLSLGSQHNKTGSNGRKQYHVVALPLLQADARNWQRAEVILDAEYCFPGAIRLIDPAGSKETVYVFPLQDIKANKHWFNDPFKIFLGGYKLVEKQVAPPPNQPPGASGRAVVPAGGAKDE